MKQFQSHYFNRIKTLLFPCILLIIFSTSAFLNLYSVQAFSRTPQVIQVKHPSYRRHAVFNRKISNTLSPLSQQQYQRQPQTRRYATTTTTLPLPTSALLTRDLILLASCGWFLLPFVRQQLRRMVGQHKARHLLKSNTGLLVLHALVQLCQVGAAIYAWDALQLVFGKTWWPRNACTTAGITWWCTEQLVRVQHLFLLQSQKSTQPLRGRRQVADRIGQVFWRAFGIYVWLDWMQIRLPRRLWAFSGTTTLVLSLAFQDLAKSFVSGLFLASSNRFYEGDGIEIDGLKGKVIQQGWMETIIRQGDEVLVSVPSIDLDKKQLANRSRVYTSQVALNLRVHYDHVGQLSQFVQDVQTELKQACPKLITDGSRPFRVHWTDYQTDHLTVAINSYYRILFGSDEYWDNRMEVLSAVNRAASRNGIRFAHAGAVLRDHLDERDHEPNEDRFQHDGRQQTEDMLLGNEISDDFIP